MLRLFLLNPAVVMAARVNLASAEYPLDQIPFDGVTTGAYTSVLPGMTVLLGGAAGLDDYGRQRVRKAATSDTIYVGRSSQGTRDGELHGADNAYITVLNDYRVWAKIARIDVDGSTDPPTVTTFKDADIEVDDNTIEPPPVANCGPGTAGTINSGTSLLTVAFDGTASFAVAYGASISTYLWNVGDGTITVGSAASSAITATFPAGFRWVSLTVTDSNGKTHTARCPVYARNPAADTTVPDWQMANHRITQSGQQVSVKVLSAIPVATYPDNTLAMIFDGEPASPSDRSHMTFIGWHHTDPATIGARRTGTLKDTTLELLDVAGKLDTLPGFPQTLEQNDAPSKWTEATHLTMDRYTAYLLHWHSTALELADWTGTGTGELYEFVVFTSDGESLWQQVEQRAKALVPNFVLTSNTLGQLRTLPDPMLQEAVNRTATVQAALTAADWSALRFTHNRPARAHWLRGSALLTSSTEIVPVFCIAPGNAPAQGEASQEQGNQLAVSQEALNYQEGQRYARLNAPESLFNITLTQSDDLDIEPANMTWVTLTLPAAQAAQRGLNFTAARGLVHEVSIRYEQGRTGLVRSVELSWERETVGISAVTEPVLEDQLPIDDIFPGPIYDPTPPDLTDPADLGLATVYMMTLNELLRTRNFNASPPTWAIIATTPITGENMHHFVLDPWSPRTTGYYASHQGVYRSVDLDQVVPTWTQIFSEANAEAVSGETTFTFQSCKILCSINVEAHVSFFWLSSSDLWFTVSTDRGNTWTHTYVCDSVSLRAASASGLVPHVVGGALHYYAAEYDGNTVWKSVDNGVSFSRTGDLEPIGFDVNGAETMSMHIPYQDNEDGQILYVGTGFRDAATDRVGGIWRSTNGGSSWTNITPVTDRGVSARNTGVETSPQNRLLVYAWMEGSLGSQAVPAELYLSTDGGDNWTLATGVVPPGNRTVQASSGFPYLTSRLYVTTTQTVAVSVDSGVTWIDKTGNIGVLLPGGWNALGRGVIVPDWTV